MDILIFVMLSYIAAGIVYITREADQKIDLIVPPTPLQHPLLRIIAGIVMMVLWPAFLVEEKLELQRAPMATKFDLRGH